MRNDGTQPDTERYGAVKLKRYKRNDDAVGRDSRITETLGPGAYTIAATTYDPQETGSYNLSIGLSSQDDSQTVATASLNPDPSNQTFYVYADREDWHTFTVNTDVPVKVRANPTSTDKRIEITTSSGAGNHCPATRNETKELDNGERIYLSGCSVGTGTVQILRRSDNSVIRTYTIEVRNRPTTPSTTVCEPLTNFNAYRRYPTWVYGTWTNPTTGLTSTNKKVDIQRKEGANWVHHQVINQRGATYTDVLHIGADRNTEYRYRVRNECGTSYSSYTSWVVVPPYSSGASGSSGDEVPAPTPTPTPEPDGAGGQGHREKPEEPPPPTPVNTK